MQNEHEWIPIVADTFSTPNYRPYQSEAFEHYFTVTYENDRPIKLLRIDIQDRFYLKEFSLIYLDTGETIEGTEIGDKFLFRFVWAAKKGNYKIASQGGKYRYSIFMLESTTKLTREPICQARSPFDMLVSWPTKDKSLYKLVSYRKVGATDWEMANQSLGKVHIEVDPTSAYEIKTKLVVADMFETEYSPTIETSAHQDYYNLDDCKPDLDFLQTTLLFELRSRIRLSHVAIILRYKPATAENWIYDAKDPPQKDGKWRQPQRIIWDIGRNLYDLLSVDNGLTIDWQLIFRNTKTGQEAGSTVKTLELQKRHKIQRGEYLQKNLAVFCDSIWKKLYLCRDGQFWYWIDRNRVDMIVPHCYFINVKGNFILERKDPKDKKCVITLFPKFKKFEIGVEIDQLSAKLLPELVKIILSFVYSPPYTQPLMLTASLNLVCKHWFNILAEGVVKVNGELSDHYYTSDSFRGRDSLRFPNWRVFNLYNVND